MNLYLKMKAFNITKAALSDLFRLAEMGFIALLVFLWSFKGCFSLVGYDR